MRFKKNPYYASPSAVYLESIQHTPILLHQTLTKAPNVDWSTAQNSPQQMRFPPVWVKSVKNHSFSCFRK